jgi:hypothetical protein
VAHPRSYIHAEGGRDSVIYIATTLLAGGYGDLIPLGQRFSVRLQTESGPRSAPCTMGTASYSGVQWEWRGVVLATHTFRAFKLRMVWSSPSTPFCACTGMSLGHLNLFYIFKNLTKIFLNFLHVHVTLIDAHQLNSK